MVRPPNGTLGVAERLRCIDRLDTHRTALEHEAAARVVEFGRVLTPLGAEVRGQVWVEWSYAVNLKQELLQPTVFARLRLEIVSQLRSHAGVALYEICTRYKEVGRTARQAWRWWQPVLTGNPPSERLARQEYRIFKRDTLKPAIAEINAITDIDVELVEHRQGRFVDTIQFHIQPKKQTALALGHRRDLVGTPLAPPAHPLGEPWRLRSSGWPHPMVVNEMIRYYAVGAYGDDWDKPTAQELLAIAAELGEGAEVGR